MPDMLIHQVGREPGWTLCGQPDVVPPPPGSPDVTCPACLHIIALATDPLTWGQPRDAGLIPDLTHWREVGRTGNVRMIEQLDKPQTSVHGDYVIIANRHYNELCRYAEHGKAFLDTLNTVRNEFR